jgi:hypothetical protein
VPANAHSADGRQGVPKPVVARYRGKLLRIHFRARFQREISTTSNLTGFTNYRDRLVDFLNRC